MKPLRLILKDGIEPPDPVDGRDCHLKLKCNVNGKGYDVDFAEFTIFPGIPDSLQVAWSVEGIPKAKSKAKAPLPAFTVAVRDAAGHPTSQYHQTSFNVTVSCPDDRIDLTGTLSKKVGTKNCIAEFKDLKLKPSADLRGELRLHLEVELTAEEDFNLQGGGFGRGGASRGSSSSARASSTSLRAPKLPALRSTIEVIVIGEEDRTPDTLRVTRSGNEIVPDGSEGHLVYVVSALAGDVVDDIVVTVLNKHGEVLPDAMLSVHRPGIASHEAQSGNPFPQLTMGELVTNVHDYNMVFAGGRGAGRGVVGALRLKPQMLKHDLVWKLTQLWQSLAIGAKLLHKTHYTIGVQDKYGNARERHPEEPEPKLIFVSMESGLSAQMEPAAGSKPLRIVGTAGTYKVHVESVAGQSTRAQQRHAVAHIKPSEERDVELAVGAPERLSCLSMAHGLGTVFSRGIIARDEHLITIVAQDEGGNTVSDISTIMAIRATSPDLLKPVVLDKDAIKGEFYLPDVHCVRSDGSAALALKFEADTTRGRNPLHPCDVTVGSGFFKNSSFIKSLMLVEPAGASRQFVTGTPVPRIVVQLQAEDETIDFHDVEESAISAKASAAPQGQPPFPSGSVSLSTTGQATVSFVDDCGAPCVFTTIGTVRVIVQYTEQREEWSWLPVAWRKSPPLVIEFTVTEDVTKPQLGLVQKPPETLFLTLQSGHACPGKLYSVTGRNQPQAYEPRMQLTDSYGHPIASIEYTLRICVTQIATAGAAAAAASADFPRKQGEVKLCGSDPRSPVQSMFPSMMLKADTQYQLSAQAHVYPSNTAVPEALQPLFNFTVTLSAHRDALLAGLEKFKASYEKNKHEFDEAKRHVESKLGRQLKQDENVESYGRQIESWEQQLTAGEGQIEAQRPILLRDVMPALATTGIWKKAPGFLGLVGEFIICDDMMVAQAISRSSKGALTNLLVLDKTDANFLMGLRRSHSSVLRGRFIKEVARFPPLNSNTGPLPHQQAGNLKGADQQQSVNYFNGQVNGHARVRRLAELFRPAPGVGLLEHDGRRVIQDVVGNKLVMDCQADALDYSRLVWRHPPIFCLDTGETEVQGAGQSLDEQRAPRRQQAVDSILLNQGSKRLHLLQQKHAHIETMRRTGAFLAPLRLLEEKETTLRTVTASLSEQRRILDELKEEEKRCTQAGQRSRQRDIDTIEKFLQARDGKRPAAAQSTAQNVHEMDDDDGDEGEIPIQSQRQRRR